MSSQASLHPVIFRLSICSASHPSSFFLIPCFNFKVQRERELFVLNCPPHDSKLSEIDNNDRSEEEQHRNNNFLQTFCQKNVKTKNFRQSEYAKAEVPLSKNLRRGNRGFRPSGGSTYAVATATAEVEVPLLRKLQNLSQCDWALRVKNFKTGILAQNSSLGLVADAQSENIGEKQE